GELGLDAIQYYIGNGQWSDNVRDSVGNITPPPGEVFSALPSIGRKREDGQDIAVVGTNTGFYAVTSDNCLDWDNGNAQKIFNFESSQSATWGGIGKRTQNYASLLS